MDVVKTVFEIAEKIYNQIDQAQANKEQCNRLAERIKIVEKAVRGLTNNRHQSLYKSALVNLTNCLNGIEKFIEKFTAHSGVVGWFIHVFRAGAHEEEFAEFNKELMGALNLFQTGLAAQNFNEARCAAEDRADQKKDLEFIAKNQHRILRLNQQINSNLQQFRGEEADHHLVLACQMMSMKRKMDQILQIPGLLGLNMPVIRRQPVDPGDHIPYDEMLFGETIHKGQYGSIYKGRWRNETVAIKLINEKLTQQVERLFVHEVQLMSRLRSPYITPFRGACLEEGKACLVMTYQAQGSLWNYLQHHRISSAQQKQFSLEIARGLEFLHLQNMIHRNLNSRHVLINQDGHTTLTDFGLSENGTQSIKSIDMQTYDTDLAWNAPETLTLRPQYSRSSDIYSYGVILWEIITGKPPYITNASNQLVKKDFRNTIPQGTSRVFHGLIGSCTANNINERPQVASIIIKLSGHGDPLPPATHALSEAEKLYIKGCRHDKNNNLVRARHYYEQAKEKGYFKAYTNLGSLILEGKGGFSSDPSVAYQYFQTAAQQGHMRAKFYLAECLEKGRGVSQNLEEAASLYKELAESGDRDSQIRLQELRNNMGQHGLFG